MGLTAGIVVTGTEVLTGRVSDLNGPWLAEQLRRLGVDVGQIVVVGDRPEDLRSALGFLAAGNDLVITSGGLGPTADDLTADVVAQVQGRPRRLDPELEQRIAAIVARLSARFGGLRDPRSTAIATRKQAMVPEGATVLEPAGTAPGLVVPVAEGRTGPPVIVLPGPPWELQRMWPAAVAALQVQAILVGAPELRQRTLRLWGVPESELAATLRRSDGDLAGLEITTCLRAGELEIVTRYPPAADAAQQRLVAAVRQDFPDQLFSEGPTIEDLIRVELQDRGWSSAVVETITGGTVAARLAEIAEPADPAVNMHDCSPGRTGFVGGIVASSEPVLTELVGVPAELLKVNTAPGVAQAMAERARVIFGADLGIAIGPASDAVSDRPGTIEICVITPDGEFTRSLSLAGPTDILRARILPVALHLLHQALARR